MARYRGTKGRNQNTIYIVAGAVVVVVVVGVIIGLDPFDADGGPTPTDTNNMSIDPEVVDPPEVNQMSFPPPIPRIEVEPNLATVEVGPGPDLKTDSRIDNMIAEAITLITTQPNRVIEARDKLNALLKEPLTGQQSSLVKTELARLAEQWLFSKTFFPQDKLCSSYMVQSGDMLSTIAARNRVPYELLMEINRISRPETLAAGKRIKIVHGPFHIKVYRSTFKMDVYLQGTYVKSFPVGLGAPGRQTPLGLWHIKAGGKIPHPIYNDPDTHEEIHPEDPRYPLGSRWMELEGLDDNTRDETSFGIHGTKEPKSIGKASSRGCIRLHNGDAIEIYNMLVPVSSLVKVLE